MAADGVINTTAAMNNDPKSLPNSPVSLVAIAFFVVGYAVNLLDREYTIAGDVQL